VNRTDLTYKEARENWQKEKLVEAANRFVISG
jgi:hypothetical protein